MSIALTAQRIRFAIDASQPFVQPPNNLLNSQPIALPSGSALQFELFFYFQQLIDANQLDLTQYTQITLALCANADPHSGTIYFQASIPFASLTAATVANWQNGTAQHAEIFIASANNVVIPANTSYWIVIWATSTDGAADSILLFCSNINGKDSGIPTGPVTGGSPVKVGTKLSFVCSDGQTRDLTLFKPPAGPWTYAISAPYNGPGQASFAMAEPGNTGLYHDLSLVLDSGEFTLAINQNGHS